MNNILNQMLEKYEIKNIQDETNAMKEIIQEIVICGLSRGNFFNEVAFYGGTALRIFYGLNRFSEDLDFSLINPNSNFDLTKYFTYIEKEVQAYGLNLKVIEKEKSKESNITRELNSYGLNSDIKVKEKTKDSNITSAFLKGDTKEHILIFFDNNIKNSNSMKNIKIKFEVDINPPLGANYELRYKLLPSPHQVRLYDKSSLFAGKIHAVLCRNWKSRTKGRDLYDYIFFLSKDIGVNLELIKSKLIQSNVISENEEFNLDILKEILIKKFSEINYTDAKEDIIPFIKDTSSLDLWNDKFFIEITQNLKL